MIRKVTTAKGTQYQCQCQRPGCRHAWTTRQGTIPFLCPGCNSAKWRLKQDTDEGKGEQHE